MNIIRKQDGQVLPFFIVAGTVLLAVIANLSLRNISSGFRSTTLDTSSRVTAAAEGGLERFLSYSYDELETAATQCTGTSAPACTVRFGDTGDDNIGAQAVVEVEPFGNTSSVEFTLGVNQTYEVNLRDPSNSLYNPADIYLCWDGNADVYYIAYSYDPTFPDPTLIKGYVCDSAGGCSAKGDSELPDGNTQCGGFDHQKSLDLSSSSGSLEGLRIRSVSTDPTVNDVRASVVVGSGSRLPIQGYRIISTGQIAEAGDVQSQVVDTKVVEVPYPFLPSYFDFAIFSELGY